MNIQPIKEVITAEEIKAEMPVAFKALGSKSRAAASLRRRSILSNERLRKWLADRLAHKLPDIAAQRDPTFADLRATGDPCDTLYVVTMDLATGQPFVLSPDLTPDVSVADAVVASSAIPVSRVRSASARACSARMRARRRRRISRVFFSRPAMPADLREA